MNEEQETGWCLIPPQVVANDELTPNEKLIFGRILGLTKKEGYCWASNLWLGKQISIEEKTVANIISALKKKGFVETKVFRDDNKHIVQRHIFVRSFPIAGTPLPAIGNSTSRDNDSIVLSVSVDNSEDNEPSDKIAEKLQILKEKHEKKNHSYMGSPFQSSPQFPPKKQRKYVDASGII